MYGIDGVLAIGTALHNLITDQCPSAFNDTSQLRTCVQRPLLLEYMRNVSFEGGLGRVEFDSNGDVIGKYTVAQMHRKGRYNSETIEQWYNRCGVGATDYLQFRVRAHVCDFPEITRAGNQYEIETVATWDRRLDDFEEFYVDEMLFGNVKFESEFERATNTVVSVCSYECKAGVIFATFCKQTPKAKNT